MFVVPANLIASAPDYGAIGGGIFANQNANLVAAGPSSGGAGAVTFRALVAADIPSGLAYVAKAGDTMTGALIVSPSGAATALTLNPHGVADVGLVIRAAGSATADLLQNQNSSAVQVSRDAINGDRFTGRRLYVCRNDLGASTATVTNSAYIDLNSSDVWQFNDRTSPTALPAYVQLAGIVNPNDSVRILTFPSAGLSMFAAGTRVALPVPVGIGIGSSAPAATGVELVATGTSSRTFTCYDGNGIRFTLQFNATQCMLGMESSADLVLTTNNTGRITISAAGNIGFFGHAAAAQPTKAGHNNWAAISDVTAALAAIGLVDTA